MAKYKINNVTADHGAISWAHSGLDTQWAESGDTVSVYNQPTAGWGLDEIFYTKTDGSGKTAIIGDEFIMPAYDIIIFASFKRFVSTDWTPDPTEGDGIVVEAGSNTTVGGYQVPQLTAEQIADIDAAMAKGKNVVVVDATGKMQFAVKQSDSVDGVAVVLDYFSTMILTYHADGTIDYVNIEGGETSVGAVRYDIEQTLNDEQKAQAQENIGAASAEALADKANIDGYYSQLTAGSAENLVGGNDTSREFTEDTAGGTADIADGIVQIEKIKGNTIVWNQKHDNTYYNYSCKSLSKSGRTLTINFKDNDYYNRFQISGSSTLPKILTNNHKMLVSFEITDYLLQDYSSDIYFTLYSYATAWSNINVNVKNKGKFRKICTYKESTASSKQILGQFNINRNFTDGDYILLKDFTIIDLTQMFGAGNEPATVAEFEKMFPLDYYDYNEGQLLGLNPSGILTDGFNQYNNANPVIKVFPQQYYIGGTYTSIWFSKNADDEEGTEITPVDHLFTPPEYGYIHVEGGNATDTVVNLHCSGKRDGEYEPYWQSTRNIDIESIKDSEGSTLFSDGLCSVGSVHDEVTSTKAVKRIAKQTITGAIGDEITLAGCKATATEYKSVSDYGTLANGVLTLTVAVTAKDVYFELATPVEVTFAEPLNLTYRVSDYGTETLLPQNGAVPTTSPIKTDVIYGLNVVDFVRNADKNFVTIEDSTSGDGSTFTNLRSALSTAFGIDIVPTYDATNKRYTFAITDNRKVEVPASATASGMKGTWAEDETAVYFCTDTNVWVKINKETWS